MANISTLPIIRRASPWRRAAAAFALTTILSGTVLGCTTVKLVSDYDDQIDSGLTQILADTTSFVDKMIARAGTPAGEYQVNQDFYTTEHGKVTAIIVRAEAHQVLGSCPSAALVGKAIEAAKASAAAKAVETAKASAAAGKYLSGGSGDDCDVVLLRQLDVELDDLKTAHKAFGAAGLPASVRDDILVGGIGATVKAGITVELAKKAGVAKGGK